MHDYANYLNNSYYSTKKGVTVNKDVDWWMEFVAGSIGKKLFIILTIIALFSLFSLYKYTQNSNVFPITNIELKGNIITTQPADIEKVLESVKSQSFFQVNLDEVADAVYQLAWVQEVNVTRKWPAGLELDIVEREAVMRWGEKELVDLEGVRFKNNNNEFFKKLPTIIGPKGSEYEVVEAYNQYASTFEHHSDIGMKKFVLNEFLSWELHLDNGVIVKFGRDDFQARVSRFSKAYKAAQIPDLDKVNIIDLRYNRGFAIKWKPEFSDKNNKDKLLKVSNKSKTNI